MADYSISFARSARKKLEHLSGVVAERILAKIEALAGNPRPAGVIKLHGGKIFGGCASANYRVVYAIDDFSKAVDVSVIRHRRDVYRDL